MKWTRQGSGQYLQAKEFIDTAVIPLVPIAAAAPDEELTKTAVQHETMQVFLNELEKELAGRIMVMPVYAYIANKEIENERVRLESWTASLMEAGFKHVFLPTFDAVWRKHSKHLEGELIWLPCPTTGQMDSGQFNQAARGLAREVMDLMMASWD